MRVTRDLPSSTYLMVKVIGIETPLFLRTISIPVYPDSLFILIYIFKFQYRRRDSLSIATRCDANEISKGFVLLNYLVPDLIFALLNFAKMHKSWPSSDNSALSNR